MEQEAKPVMFVVGHKEGRVVLQSHGEDPHWFSWTPQEARQIAALVLEAADTAEQTAS